MESLSVYDDLEVMRLHVKALFSHDAVGRMTTINESDGAPAPRFFIGRTSRGSIARFRHDVSTELQRVLEAHFSNEGSADEFLDPPHGAAPFEAALSASALVEKRWAGPAYCVPSEAMLRSAAVLVRAENDSVLNAYFSDWRADVGRVPFAALVIGGDAVSICASVRVTDAAHEAGVETHPDFRGRGFAKQAVAAWASELQASSILPLYSTSWENAASQGVARSLGLVRFGADLHFT